MKKLLTLIISICALNLLEAQKQLQIDSVFTVNFTLNSVNTSKTMTVPNNRVWKIEAITKVCFNSGSTSSTMNGRRTNLDAARDTPFWLGTNDVVKINFASGDQCQLVYSIIQFRLE